VILLPRAVRVYFATKPTNLRQSFEGLTNQFAELGGQAFTPVGLDAAFVFAYAPL
jgi:hypothetical protein